MIPSNIAATMHKLILSLAAAWMVQSGLAQVTIGQNEMPQAGNTLWLSRATPNPLLNFSATGASHSWDFSGLVAMDQQSTSYQTVASTNLVYALVYADLPFNPNRANHATEGVDIPFHELLPIENPHTFLLRSASQYRKVGFGAEVSGIPVPIIFDQADVIYQLPLVFGSTQNSQSAYSVQVPELLYYGYRQERTNEVDGWGTLSTPAGSFDVLRVKTTLQGRDSIQVDQLSLGFGFQRPVVREYKWLAQGVRTPVLQINTVEILGVEVITEVWYHDQPRQIEVLQPLAATLCAGADITVHYEVAGSFNSGGLLWPPANVFRAQLSDASGSFAEPLTIGQVTSNTSGTIAATIPVNIPAGAGYRIRVTASSPSFIGQDNGFDISIGTAPQAIASAQGPTAFCAGGEVLLAAGSGEGLTYQWQMDGADLDGAVEAEWLANAPGSYIVLVTGPCGTAASEAIAVEVYELPVHTIEASSPLLCPDGTVVLSATDQAGVPEPTYQWWLNGAPIPEGVTSTWTTNVPGEYHLSVIDEGTGCAFLSEAYDVELADAPNVPSIEADGPTEFCPGGAVLLSALAMDAQAYQWWLDGQPLPEGTDGWFEASMPGSYTVLISDANGCASAASEPVLVGLLAAPDIPVIEADNGLAICQGQETTLSTQVQEGASYQWTLDGQDIDGATGLWLTALVGGTYSVSVTSGQGCVSSALEEVLVEFFLLPEVPVIEADGDLLATTGEGSFQWFLNGEPIDGATASTWTAIAPGEYTVLLTDANGCTSLSEPYTYSTVGMAHVGGDAFQVYPNPSAGSFFLQLANADQVGATAEVRDAAGRTVYRATLSATTSHIDLGQAPAGVYVLHVNASAGVMVQRLVVGR